MYIDNFFKKDITLKGPQPLPQRGKTQKKINHINKTNDVYFTATPKQESTFNVKLLKRHGTKIMNKRTKIK